MSVYIVYQIAGKPALSVCKIGIIGGLRSSKMKIDWDEFERTRGEFKHDGKNRKDRMERSDQEHPEQAYRRGVQQGAYFVLEVLEAAPDSINVDLLLDIHQYVQIDLARWRYNSRRLHRRLGRDDPPRPERWPPQIGKP
jgi:transposase InsO family protein